MIFRIIGGDWVWENTDENGEISDSYRKIEATKSCVDRLTAEPTLTVDTETTGLKWMKFDRPFSIALHVDGQPPYYINFKDYKDQQLDMLDPFERDWLHETKDVVGPIFDAPRVWIGQNLKFDLHMMREFGLPLKGTFYCTMVGERLLSNDDFSYSLESMVKRHLPDFKKDDAVEKYIDDNGLYIVEDIPGKKGKFKNKFYDMVPFRVIAPYAANDGLITTNLASHQRQRFRQNPALGRVLRLEMEVLKLSVEMEARGVLIDRKYCEKGLKFETKRIKKVETWFKKEFKKKFIDSEKELVPLFEELGFKPPRTEKDNASLGWDFLSTIDHELARQILEHRDASKRANTYFQNFISLSDSNDVLHPDMLQSGTRTGRFSYRDPNLQNIPAEDESEFPIRRALIPRPGHFFLMIDYQQQEFRMMLDYAGQIDLIEKIKAGHDPHQATADLCNITRKQAKVINFGLMYGMGIQKLANNLGVSYEEAKELKYKYFAALPYVKRLIYKVSDEAKANRRVYTWMNRKLDFNNPDFAYKAINAIIQGGCADVTKEAMVRCSRYLTDSGKKTRAIMQVHDELLFEVPFEEFDVVGPIKEIMETVYPSIHIPLTTSLSYSVKSFHDSIEVETKEEIEKAVREHIQEQSEEISGEPSTLLVRENAAGGDSGNPGLPDLPKGKVHRTRAQA